MWDPHPQLSLSGVPLTSCFIYCGSRLNFIPKGVSLQSGSLNCRKEEGTKTSWAPGVDGIIRKQRGLGAKDGPDHPRPPHLHTHSVSLFS